MKKYSLNELIKSKRPITYGIVQPGPDVSPNGVPLIRGKDYSSGKVSTERLYHVLPSIDEPYSRSRVETNDILLSIAGYVGQVAIVPKELEGANITQTTARLSCDVSKVYSKFLFYVLQSETFYRTQVKKYEKGSAQSGLNLSDVGTFKVDLPPKPQQTKIAKILTTIDNVIEKTEEAIAKYEAIKHGMMHDLFTRGIGEDGWNSYTLGDLANIIDPHPSHRAPEIDERGIPFLGIGDLDEEGNIIKKARTVSISIFDEHSRRYTLCPDTIGFGRVATIGKVIRFKNYNSKITISPTMAIIEPLKIESDYLAYFLNSNLIKLQIDKLLTGSTRSSLGIELLRGLIIQVPNSEFKKKKIYTSLNAINNKISIEKQILSKQIQLKKGLMQDLLTGKVVVNY